MHKGFSTELNPQKQPIKKSSRLRTIEVDLPTSKKQLTSYVQSLDSKLNTAVMQQLSNLKIKHLQLGGILSGMQAQRNKLKKETAKKQQDLKNSFQQYLMRDIQRFQGHKEFFKKYFNSFSSQLNEALDKRNKLLVCVQELRKKLREIKRQQIRRVGQSVILPSISQLRTSKTIRTTQPTQRSIRISTDILQPMSPILMRMGGSQPVLGSRIHQPIKAQSSSTKKSQRKYNIQFLRSLFQQRNNEKDQLSLSNFEKVLFQRRNFTRLIQFFQCIEMN